MNSIFLTSSFRVRKNDDGRCYPQFVPHSQPIQYGLPVPISVLLDMYLFSQQCLSRGGDIAGYLDDIHMENDLIHGW